MSTREKLLYPQKIFIIEAKGVIVLQFIVFHILICEKIVGKLVFLAVSYTYPWQEIFDI